MDYPLKPDPVIATSAPGRSGRQALTDIVWHGLKLKKIIFKIKSVLIP
jgi:hypothetical protein